MPVRKFRSVEEMPDYPEPSSSPLAGIQAACELSGLVRAFGWDLSLPRGVRKFRSVEEAARFREDAEHAAWTRGRVLHQQRPAHS